jgi:tubulin polyglutamylase TTLL5
MSLHFTPCTTTSAPVKSSLPAQVYFHKNSTPIVRETILFNGLMTTNKEPKTSTNSTIQTLLIWSGNYFPEEMYIKFPAAKLNHFINSSEITRKDRLYSNYREFQREFPSKSANNFIPETFILPREKDQLVKKMVADKISDSLGMSPPSLWICKPTALSRGRGIYLISSPSDIVGASSSSSTNGGSTQCVVSRYISNPYLIQGLKFDLRVYVLVTSFDPLRIYVYKEGLTRFASDPFNMKDIENKFSHLTNYAVNKGSKQFVENQDFREDNMGHKWSMSALMKHLQVLNVDTNLIEKRIHDLVVKTIILAQKHINTQKLNAFELFGFDIILDSDLNPWLLEVNLSPSLATESPLDRKVKAHLIADMFNLVGIGEKPGNYDGGLPNYLKSADERSKPAIMAGLAELKREHDWRTNFVRVYPTAESVVKYRKYFRKPETLAKLTLLFNQLLFPSISLRSVIPSRTIEAVVLKKTSKGSSKPAALLSRSYSVPTARIYRLKPPTSVFSIEQEMEGVEI